MRYVLIFIYVAVSILLFVLNWDLFTTSVNVDMGFGTLIAWPFFILQIFGLIILAVFAIFDGMKDLKRELKISELQNKIVQMQKDAEIADLKKTKENKPVQHIEKKGTTTE
jgi:Mg2+/citrate symporter